MIQFETFNGRIVWINCHLIQAIMADGSDNTSTYICFGGEDEYRVKGNVVEIEKIINAELHRTT